MTTWEAVFFAIAVVCYLGAACGAVVRVVREGIFTTPLVRGTALLGLLSQTTAIGIHCGTTAHPQFAAPFAILSLAAWSAALLYLVAGLWIRAPGLGACLMPAVAALSLSALFLTGEPQAYFPEIAPFEHNPLFIVHVLAAFLGYAAFLLVVAGAAMYLVQARQLKVKLFGRLFEALPALETLERLQRAATLAGVLLFAIALSLGALLARQSDALQAGWLLKPKIFLALLTLVAFAGLALAQRLPALRGRRAARLALVAFVFAVLTIFLGHFAAAAI